MNGGLAGLPNQMQQRPPSPFTAKETLCFFTTPALRPVFVTLAIVSLVRESLTAFFAWFVFIEVFSVSNAYSERNVAAARGARETHPRRSRRSVEGRVIQTGDPLPFF